MLYFILMKQTKTGKHIDVIRSKSRCLNTQCYMKQAADCFNTDSENVL